MLFRTLTLSLLVLVFQQPTDSPKVKAKSSDVMATPETNLAAQQDPCARCERQLNAEQSNSEKLRGELERLSRELDALRQKGGGAGNDKELAAARNQIINLNAKLESAAQDIDRLNKQIAPLRSDNERLKGENSRLSNESEKLRGSLRDLELRLSASDRSLAELRQQSAATTGRDELRVERDNLRAQLKGQQESYAALQQRYDELSAASNSSREASDAIASKFTACTEQLQQNPSLLLNTAAAAQRASGSEGGTAIRINDDGGDAGQCKTHIIRDLVIGTLDISFDKDEVRAGHSFPLKAVFKPHSILKPDSIAGADERDITWRIELQYAPKHLTATYDRQQSGNRDQLRTVDPSQEQTWVWQLNTAKDFESDLSDLILFAGYETAGAGETKDLLREPIKLAIPPGPGFVAVFKENLNYILGIIATVLGICTGYLGLKQKKQSAQQNAPQGGQP
ncbi:MAG TPA: hypothetical protein VJT82_06085 [Pyrinomonadaceae bacterium]|nr:hypothetical protein [Pyrinomonadaceae bacterium]